MQSKFLFLLQVDHFRLIIIFWALHMFELFLLTIRIWLWLLYASVFNGCFLLKILVIIYQ